MANAIRQNNSRYLWDKKKVRNTNPTYSNCVDAAIGADNIVYCLQISIMLYIILYVMNIMKCLICVMILDMILISIV